MDRLDRKRGPQESRMTSKLLACATRKGGVAIHCDEETERSSLGVKFKELAWTCSFRGSAVQKREGWARLEMRGHR